MALFLTSSSFDSAAKQLISPRILFALTWTFLLLATVGVASLTAEHVFTSAVSPCGAEGLVRIPLDASGELMCLPAGLIRPSGFDALVPLLIAALLVAASANMINNLAFWNWTHHHHHQHHHSPTESWSASMNPESRI